MKSAYPGACACLLAMACLPLNALAGVDASAASAPRVAPAQVQTASAAQTADAVQMLDKAIALVREHAYHVDRIDWVRTESRLRAMVRAGAPPADAYPAIRALLEALGDGHSFLMPAATAAMRSDTGTRAVTVASPPTLVLVLRGETGFVAMPGFTAADPAAQQAFAAGIGNAIAAAAAQTRCGWVVDLRDDTGGNMWPMLAALRPLLGNGVLGTMRPRDGSNLPWSASGMPLADAQRWPDLTQVPVAVLQGPRTSSAGEAVAVAFRGRTATRSLGLPSDGRVSANMSLQLPDGSMLAIASAYYRDRNGQLYLQALQPDQRVAVDPGAIDSTVGQAQAWLATQGRCAGGGR
ncbi:S41 family peptidase [Xanthomonas sp. SI]|uniref:S41 family peptidase n=1 Tax=Xanthomonas sp. SI TaxID=2724123 RepID=UPI001639BD03|nr:S41 family peptidase [Xanthomonas sp. SI]QNH11346.1 nisin-resistance protein [Xanthomonas sp. SI]